MGSKRGHMCHSCEQSPSRVGKWDHHLWIVVKHVKRDGGGVLLPFAYLWSHTKSKTWLLPLILRASPIQVRKLGFLLWKVWGNDMLKVKSSAIISKELYMLYPIMQQIGFLLWINMLDMLVNLPCHVLILVESCWYNHNIQDTLLFRVKCQDIASWAEHTEIHRYLGLFRRFLKLIMDSRRNITPRKIQHGSPKNHQTFSIFTQIMCSIKPQTSIILGSRAVHFLQGRIIRVLRPLDGMARTRIGSDWQFLTVPYFGLR